MKKKYVTPMIAVEHYELTQTIAACSIKIGALDSKCVIKDPDATNEMRVMAANNWFTAEGSCGLFEIGASIEDGFCYHTSTQTSFTS